jgi:Ca2+-binding EF-hand superfamily protein
MLTSAGVCRGLLRRSSRGVSDEETLEGIWLRYDADKDGFISQQEMRDALRRECCVTNEVIYVM